MSAVNPTVVRRSQVDIGDVIQVNHEGSPFDGCLMCVTTTKYYGVRARIRTVNHTIETEIPYGRFDRIGHATITPKIEGIEEVNYG